MLCIQQLTLNRCDWKPYLTPPWLSSQEIQTCSKLSGTYSQRDQVHTGGKVEVRLVCGDYAQIRVSDTGMVSARLSMYLIAFVKLIARRQGHTVDLDSVGDRAAGGTARRKHLCGDGEGREQPLH